MLGIKLIHVIKRGHWTNGQYLVNGSFKCILLKAILYILLKFSVKLVPGVKLSTMKYMWQITVNHGVREFSIEITCHQLGDAILPHYGDIIMGTIASQITSLTIVYSIFYSDADQRKHQSSASLAFVRGIHRGPVNSPHKWPVTRKMFPFDDVIMSIGIPITKIRWSWDCLSL